MSFRKKLEALDRMLAAGLPFEPGAGWEQQQQAVPESISGVNPLLRQASGQGQPCRELLWGQGFGGGRQAVPESISGVNPLLDQIVDKSINLAS
jgi:hypothetical protein